MFDIGGSEALIILLAVLLLFGAKRIPDVAKSLGSGIREFRRAMREITDEVHAAASVPETPPPRALPEPFQSAATPPATPAAPPSLPAPDHSVAQGSAGQGPGPTAGPTPGAAPSPTPGAAPQG